MPKSNHKVPIVRITELLKHPNADSLSIVKIGGYQCVVKTDNYKVGDLAVYVQPDSVENGQVGFRAFDVLDAEGNWVPVYEHADADKMAAERIPDNWAPVLYAGPFDETKIKTFVDGPSQVPGAKNIREGVVIKPVRERHVHGLGRLSLKIVSNAFLEKV